MDELAAIDVTTLIQETELCCHTGALESFVRKWLRDGANT